MEEFSFRWFSAYYLALGTLMVLGGFYLFARRGYMVSYIIHAAEHEKPPRLWLQIVKFFFFFTIPCLILAFFPFSWPELIFSLWCLLIAYVLGQFLLYWKPLTTAIKTNTDQVQGKVMLIAANMLSLGIIMFLLYFYLQMRL